MLFRSTLSSPGADQYGTTRVAAAVGSTVTAYALLCGHPWNIFRKILTSSGTAGLYGAHDTLPETWGIGIASDLTDSGDLARYQGLVTHSGTYEWAILVSAPLTNGFAWLRDLYSAAGFFPVIRQGQISLRCGHAMTPPAYETGHTITPDDIAEVVSGE